jgi:hypothetical protein
MAACHVISANLARTVLSYDPDTGELRWLQKRGKIRAGTVAGTINKYGYVALGVFKMPCLAHRLAWLLTYDEWPEGHIDHINGVRHDNRIANLRVATQLVNTQNRHAANKGTRSGLIGASWKTKIQRWVAQIRHGGKLHHLGYFESAESAHAAYIDAKRRLHVGCEI